MSYKVEKYKKGYAVVDEDGEKVAYYPDVKDADGETVRSGKDQAEEVYGLGKHSSAD